MEDRWVSGALRMSSNTRFLHWAKHSQGMQNSYWGKNKTKWDILFFCKVMQINIIFNILFCLLQSIVLISAGQLQILLVCAWHRERNELCVKKIAGICTQKYSLFGWLVPLTFHQATVFAQAVNEIQYRVQYRAHCTVWLCRARLAWCLHCQCSAHTTVPFSSMVLQVRNHPKAIHFAWSEQRISTHCTHHCAAFDHLRKFPWNGRLSLISYWTLLLWKKSFEETLHLLTFCIILFLWIRSKFR